jgi:CTP synthase
VPLMLIESGLDQRILTHLQLVPRATVDTSDWQRLLQVVKNPEHTVEIAVSGKYIELHDAYKSIYESLSHAGIANHCKVRIRKVSAEQVANEGADKLLAGVDGILVPGGFGDRGIEGKIAAVRYARERGVPYFGICLGMQCAVIEYARHACGLAGANSTEFEPNTSHNVIDLLPEQRSIAAKGGTMRLGNYPIVLGEGSVASRLYGEGIIRERHRHRYEVNNDYLRQLEKAGLRISGVWAEKQLVEIIEVPEHPFFVASQFHPEFRSRPWAPHPLFAGFVSAALAHGNAKA